MAKPIKQLQNPLDQFTVAFERTELFYSFAENRKEISGVAGETFQLSILFPNTFFADDFDDAELIEIDAPFPVSFSRNTIVSDTQIDYTITIEQTLPFNEAFQGMINLVPVDGYEMGIISSLELVKPVIDFQRSGNPAANFYDTSDQFYRLRGDYWRVDNDVENGCEWFSHNVFSVPVIVSSEDPNGILVDDGGTANPNDDVYHHRYKIGFVSPNAPIGTNPFAFRNILEGESSSSPGFNLAEALEFFPTDGTSQVGGVVFVIKQTAIVIRSADDAVFNIPIEGTGSYALLDENTNLWRIDLEVKFDFTSVDGSMRTLPIVLYNQSGQPEPAPVDDSCFEPIQL